VTWRDEGCATCGRPLDFMRRHSRGLWVRLNADMAYPDTHPLSLRGNDCVFSRLAHEFPLPHLIPRELTAKGRDCAVYSVPARARRPDARVFCRQRKLLMRRVCTVRGKLTAKAGWRIFEVGSIPGPHVPGTGGTFSVVRTCRRDRGHLPIRWRNLIRAKALCARPHPLPELPAGIGLWPILKPELHGRWG
jgi:hypothetical protein